MLRSKNQIFAKFYHVALFRRPRRIICKTIFSHYFEELRRKVLHFHSFFEVKDHMKHMNKISFYLPCFRILLHYYLRNKLKELEKLGILLLYTYLVH